ncbi:zinc finger protein 700-like [Culicoides brevitarsis]|uniref:zinc finger protein 700-like n=1 Tax=Culicoides brevitarsis TaxID=469753 RepID=UPI00307BD900
MSDLSDSCRCCLLDVSCLDISKYFSLDDPIQLAFNVHDATDFDGKSYRTVFEEYAGFKVLPGEPDNLCANCRTRLLDGWKFWKLLRKTQNVLQETLLKEATSCGEEISVTPPVITIVDSAAVEKEERQLAEETKDILAYLAEDLNISEECKNIDTLPPLTLDLDLDALIDGHAISMNLDGSSPKKRICPFSPNKAYKNIDMHLSRKHRDLKTIKCTTMGCRRTFYTAEMLSEHLSKDCGRRPSVVRTENQQNFTCKFCGRDFDAYQKVRSHENAHRTRIKAAKEGPRYKCDICQKLFMEKKNVRLHIESVHLRLQKLRCAKCDAKFFSDSGYRYHMTKFHKNHETFKCQECDYETKVRFMLTRHQKRHEKPATDDEIVNHECPLCLTKLKTNQLLHTHLQKVHGSKIILCKMPKKASSESSEDEKQRQLQRQKQLEYEEEVIKQQGEILAEINHQRSPSSQLLLSNF